MTTFDTKLSDVAGADPVDELFEAEPELERWRLLSETVRLHRRALEEHDGVERERLLQQVMRLHTRWTQSQKAAGPPERSFAPVRRPRA